jgi:hypothetical protein
MPLLGEKGEHGYVTAETAFLLPLIFGIGYALALVVVLAGDQIRCADAAWEAARALARGSPTAQLPAIAGRYAPSGARASSWAEDGSMTVEVERDQGILSRFLPPIRLSATATVPCEPRVTTCRADPTNQTDGPDAPQSPNA